MREILSALSNGADDSIPVLAAAIAEGAFDFRPIPKLAFL